MGYENETPILRSDQNFRSDARVWRMHVKRGASSQDFFGPFDSPTGQSEINHPGVLADKLPPVWAEHLPLQYEALSGRGDTCLTVDEPIDPTLLKPMDQMTLDEIQARGLIGVSIDTGVTYQKAHPDGTTTSEKLRRFYPGTCLTNIKLKPASLQLSYKNTNGTILTATYSRILSNITIVTNSMVHPDMYPPPKEM